MPSGALMVPPYVFGHPIVGESGLVGVNDGSHPPRPPENLGVGGGGAGGGSISLARGLDPNLPGTSPNTGA